MISDESSFRTVNPGDAEPLIFAGYGLVVDLTSCSDYGKVYVRKYAFAPAGAESDVLAYYWEISVGDDLVFEANISVVYDQTEIVRLGLPEDNLVVLKSSDSGATWLSLPTERDPMYNSLSVQGIDSSCWLAIAGNWDQ